MPIGRPRARMSRTLLKFGDGPGSCHATRAVSHAGVTAPDDPLPPASTQCPPRCVHHVICGEPRANGGGTRVAQAAFWPVPTTQRLRSAPCTTLVYQPVREQGVSKCRRRSAGRTSPAARGYMGGSVGVQSYRHREPRGGRDTADPRSPGPFRGNRDADRDGRLLHRCGPVRDVRPGGRPGLPAGSGLGPPLPRPRRPGKGTGRDEGGGGVGGGGRGGGGGGGGRAVREGR